jgi:hypothetical protein
MIGLYAPASTAPSPQTGFLGSLSRLPGLTIAEELADGILGNITEIFGFKDLIAYCN